MKRLFFASTLAIAPWFVTACGGAELGCDPACAGGLECSGGVCVAGCVSDRDCTGGGTCSDSGVCELEVTSARYTLTINVGGEGRGNVTSSSGILCGSSSSTCTIEIKKGAIVTLTADESGSSEFAGWGGACESSDETCQITMDSDYEVEATFEAPCTPYTCGGTVCGVGVEDGCGGELDCGACQTLTLNLGYDTGLVGAASIASTPSFITCTVDDATPNKICNVTVEEGTEMLLTRQISAADQSCFDFTWNRNAIVDPWEGDDNLGSTTLAVTVDEDKTLNIGFFSCWN